MEKPGLISQVQVQKAVEALVKISQKSQSTNTLFSDVDAVHLQFAVKKIDAKQRKLPLKLPNGLNRQQEVCLFVKDLDRSDRDYEQTVRHFKRSLKEQGIQCISQVIPLKALKLEYKPFEAKRKLSNSFDVFLADARIIRLLPSFLGKAFYGRKRQPIQIRMDCKDLKGEIEAAISNSQCHWSGKGSVGMATVGYMDMSPAELVQNITASAEQIAAAIPGGAINVRSMHIKTGQSLSIPIHMSMGSANDVKLEATKREKTPVVTDEVTTVEDGLVKVYPSGVVKVVNQTQKASRSKTVARVGKKHKTVKRIGKHQKRIGKHQKKSGKRQKKK